jgi:hypothetical protein
MRRHRRPRVTSDEEDDIDELELRAALLLSQLSGVVAEMTDLLRGGDDEPRP